MVVCKDILQFYKRRNLQSLSIYQKDGKDLLNLFIEVRRFFKKILGLYFKFILLKFEY